MEKNILSKLVPIKSKNKHNIITQRIEKCNQTIKIMSIIWLSICKMYSVKSSITLSLAWTFEDLNTTFEFIR